MYFIIQLKPWPQYTGPLLSKFVRTFICTVALWIVSSMLKQMVLDKGPSFLLFILLMCYNWQLIILDEPFYKFRFLSLRQHYKTLTSALLCLRFASYYPLLYVIMQIWGVGALLSISSFCLSIKIRSSSQDDDAMEEIDFRGVNKKPKQQTDKAAEMVKS